MEMRVPVNGQVGSASKKPSKMPGNSQNPNFNITLKQFTKCYPGRFFLTVILNNLTLVLTGGMQEGGLTPHTGLLLTRSFLSSKMKQGNLVKNHEYKKQQLQQVCSWVHKPIPKAKMKIDRYLRISLKIDRYLCFLFNKTQGN